jgi:hypothetical protein
MSTDRCETITDRINADSQWVSLYQNCKPSYEMTGCYGSNALGEFGINFTREEKARLKKVLAQDEKRIIEVMRAKEEAEWEEICKAVEAAKRERDAAMCPQYLKDHDYADCKKMQEVVDRVAKMTKRPKWRTDWVTSAIFCFICGRCGTNECLEERRIWKDLEPWRVREAATPSAPPEPRCCVCQDAVATHAFMPCLHKCVCESCGDGVMGHNHRCPICRGDAMGVGRVFS